MALGGSRSAFIALLRYMPYGRGCLRKSGLRKNILGICEVLVLDPAAHNWYPTEQDMGPDGIH